MIEIVLVLIGLSIIGFLVYESINYKPHCDEDSKFEVDVLGDGIDYLNSDELSNKNVEVYVSEEIANALSSELPLEELVDDSVITLTTTYDNHSFDYSFRLSDFEMSDQINEILIEYFTAVKNKDVSISDEDLMKLVSEIEYRGLKVEL